MLSILPCLAAHSIIVYQLHLGLEEGHFID
jgi:hypothetical protein